MIENTVLILVSLLFILLAAVILRQILTRQQLIGRPPVPVFFFLLAKLLVIVNLSFLVMYVFRIRVPVIFEPPAAFRIAALFLLPAGILLLFLSAFRLNKDLVFGLSGSKEHHLQTKGIYSVSRHPFYLGFLAILLSSCLLTPNGLNIAAFAGTWIIHHFIMIQEERSLEAMHGEEYMRYRQKVGRYLRFK